MIVEKTEMLTLVFWSLAIVSWDGNIFFTVLRKCDFTPVRNKFGDGDLLSLSLLVIYY